MSTNTKSSAAAASNQNQAETAVKCQYKNDMRRFSISSSDTYAATVFRVQEMYALSTGCVLRYQDDEGDHVTLANDSDLRVALNLVSGGSLPVLRLFVEEPVKPKEKQPSGDAPHGTTTTNTTTTPTTTTSTAEIKEVMQDLAQILNTKSDDELVRQALSSLRKAVFELAVANAIEDERETPCEEHKSNQRVCVSPLKAKLVNEVSPPSGADVLPTQVLVKTWQLVNNGTVSWGTGLRLVRRHGNLHSVEPAFSVRGPVGPGATVEVSATVVSPKTLGACRAVFRLQDDAGRFFGPRLRCEFRVVTEETKILADARAAQLAQLKASKKAEAVKARLSWRQAQRKKKQDKKETKGNKDRSTRPVRKASFHGENPKTRGLARRSWLPAAVAISPFKAKFVHEVTLRTGSDVLSDQTLLKTWKLENNGAVAWDGQVKLVYTKGSLEPVCPSVAVATPVEPGAAVEVSTMIHTPSALGRHRGVFRLQDAAGRFFGPRIWCDVTVVSEENKAVAEVRQAQLAQLKARKKAEAAKARSQIRAQKVAWRQMKTEFAQQMKAEWKEHKARQVELWRQKAEASGLKTAVESCKHSKPSLLEVPKPPQAKPPMQAAKAAVEAGAHAAALDQLSAMGFHDSQRNLQLLKQHAGCVQTACHHLLGSNE
jgi:hypothetical protein